MLKQKHNIVAAIIFTTALFTACHGGAFEAGIIPVVNVITMSLLVTSSSGNEILSGGACKIEGSIFVLIVNIILTVLFVLLNSKKKSNNS